MAFKSNQTDTQDNNTTNNDEPKQLNGSGGMLSPNSSRVANFSTGANPTQANTSGRFTNLQKYINANEGAGQRIGQQVQSNINKNVSKQDKEISNQNKLISESMTKGQEALGQGRDFTNQLGGIQQGFQSFQSMDQRDQFDKAGQDVLAFQQAPTFGQFQTIQSGQAIDNTGLTEAQQQALAKAQELQKFTSDNLNNIQTEQGRFSLLQGLNKNRPSAGKFTSGGTRLDQLLFQGDSSNPIDALKNTFLGQTRQADVLNKNILDQGTSVQDLLTQEEDVVGKLKNQALGTQTSFNEALYGDKNFANNLQSVTQARQQRFEDLKNSLLSGKISQQDAEMLGILDDERYNPTSAESNPFNKTVTGVTGITARPGIKSGAINNAVSVGGKSLYTPGNVGLYNLLKDPNNINKYISQNNPNATSAQDITSADDYNVYSALRNLTGVDTGKVAGSSQLGSSINTMNNQLEKDIQAQNAALKKQSDDGYFNRNQQNLIQVGNNADWNLQGKGPSLSTTLQIAEELKRRGINPNQAYTTNLNLDDVFNTAGLTVDGRTVGIGGFNFSPTQASYDGFQQQMYSNNLQDLINKGYFNELQVDESLNKPSRYKGLL